MSGVHFTLVGCLIYRGLYYQTIRIDLLKIANIRIPVNQSIKWNVMRVLNAAYISGLCAKKF